MGLYLRVSTAPSTVAEHLSWPVRSFVKGQWTQLYVVLALGPEPESPEDWLQIL